MNIYKESVLPNGLKVITSENKNSDLITLSIWIKAGSRYEKADEFGYAHILEHILLKGSKKYPSVLEISVARDRMGALSNAFTGPDRIYLFIQAAKNNLLKMFDIMADSVLNPLFDEKVLANEKLVIIQEINRSKDDYSSLLWRVSNEKLFEGHPLAHNILGDEKSVVSADRQKLTDYYRKFFTPDRMAIIATGGISHKTVLDFSKKLFGKLKKGNIDNNLQTPKINGGTFFKKAPSKQTFVVFKYAMPKLNLRESAALGILDDYLGYGQSGLLKQELRHKLGLVYGVASGINSYQDVGIFFVEAQTTKPKEAIAAITYTLKDLEKKFNKKIFAEIKMQTRSVFLRIMNDPMAELKALGNFWILENRLVSPKEIMKIIKDVSYKDALTVKNKYLKSKNLLIATLGKNKSG